MTTQEGREIFYFKIPVFLIDLFVHLSTFWLVLRLLPHSSIADIINVDAEEGIYFLIALSFSATVGIFGLRLHERKIRLRVIFWRALLQTILTYTIMVVMVVFIYKVVPRQVVTAQTIIALPVITIWHLCANLLVRRLRHMGYNTRHVVIVGADETALSVYKELNMGRGFTGYKVLGFFTSMVDVILPEGAKLLGNVDDAGFWIEQNMPDEVYCALPPASCPKEVNSLIKVCNENFINFYYVPTMDGYPHRSMVISRLGNVNVIKLHEEPLDNPFYKIFKRGADIIISLIFLCTIYPFIYLFVFIGTKLSSPGPVYFKQMRTGYNGESFKMYKFRSMRINEESDTTQATQDDPRKTKFGDFLRRSSIDELPQFINVLKGDMSIIGPRPHMEYHTDLYSSLIGDYMVRHLTKPGLTGWAQVNGCRGETQSVEDMKDRVEHDIWYIEHWSPWLDVEIFFRTIWQVLGGDNQAY